MLINIIIIVILFWSIRRGIRRGFVHEVINLIGYGISIFGGLLLARPINLLIQEWLFDNTDLSPVITFGLRNVIFFGVFAGIWFVFRMIKRALLPIKKIPVIGPLNGALGGIASFLLCYLIIFVVLLICQALPMADWQTAVKHSGVAQWILIKTPILSKQFSDLWQAYGGGIII